MMVLHFRITVKGALDDSWSAWFDCLAGAARHQAALYGCLARMCDLCLTLFAVERRAASAAACRSGQPDDP
jgi:hypothetical protein